ncbi:unnamed protein product, partial [marine sediment metagenome]
MDKGDFLYIVRNSIFDNPEWMEDTIKICSKAVLDKIQEERRVNVSVQTSLLMLQQKQFGKLD